MRAHRILATVTLLAMLGTAHAARVLEQPEEGYELSLEQLTLPSSASGGVTMKLCDACAYSTHVLTNGTRYFVNRQVVPFDEFKRIAEELRADRVARETALTGLFIDVDTGRVTRMTLHHKGL
jgi:hypothetical protein